MEATPVKRRRRALSATSPCALSLRRSPRKAHTPLRAPQIEESNTPASGRKKRRTTRSSAAASEKGARGAIGAGAAPAPAVKAEAAAARDVSEAEVARLRLQGKAVLLEVVYEDGAHMEGMLLGAEWRVRDWKAHLSLLGRCASAQDARIFAPGADDAEGTYWGGASDAEDAAAPARAAPVEVEDDRVLRTLDAEATYRVVLRGA